MNSGNQPTLNGSMEGENDWLLEYPTSGKVGLVPRCLFDSVETGVVNPPCGELQTAPGLLSGQSRAI